MKKILTSLIIILAALNLVQAQKEYVKFNIDTTFKNKVKVIIGEIIPYSLVKDSGWINLDINNVIIPKVRWDSISFVKVTSVETYLSEKESLVQLKRGNIVYVNVEKISSNDTVRLISETGNQLVKLTDQRKAEVRKSECGKIFRLIITNTPTIYYNSEELKELKEGLPWWCYLLFGVVLIGVVYVIYRIMKKMKSKKAEEPKYVLYNGNSLKDFADNNNLSLHDLIKFNKGLIDKKYERFNERDRKLIQKEIKGKELLVGNKNKFDIENSDDLINPKSPEVIPINDEISTFQETNKQLSSHSNTDNIHQLLNRLERNIVNEIQSTLSRSNENSNELNRLKTELSNLKSENIKFRTDNQNLDSKIIHLLSDKELLDRNIYSLSDEKSKKDLELKQLQEIVIAVNFLSGYCESALIYFKLCNDVINDAYSYFNRISQQNIQRAAVLGHLLTKFQISINAIPVGNWIQMIQDMNDTGATTNKKLIRSFSQIQSEEEKKREFQRLLFSEVLIKYSSSILILAEEFRNLVHFQIPTEFAGEVQGIFSKHISELNIKIRSTGLENKYVPLFQNFEKFLGNIESVGRERNFAYREINVLEKGAIAEIISYGIKTSFEDTKTLIILA